MSLYCTDLLSYRRVIRVKEKDIRSNSCNLVYEFCSYRSIWNGWWSVTTYNAYNTYVINNKNISDTNIIFQYIIQYSKVVFRYRYKYYRYSMHLTSMSLLYRCVIIVSILLLKHYLPDIVFFFFVFFYCFFF